MDLAGFDGWWMAGGWREGIGSLESIVGTLGHRLVGAPYCGVPRSAPKDSSAGLHGDLCRRRTWPPSRLAKGGFAGEGESPLQDI